MSFQGDVGGIGLADLLQSLARGREGVLTLTTKPGLKSTLGIQGGLLHLLPEIDEDPETWRNRARQAWVKDPDFRIDSLRMQEIARAQRIENLYRLLDSDGVHFRFIPGPLPQRPVDSPLSQGESGVPRKGPRRDAVYCQGMSVEGLLLEYARLNDEIQSAGPSLVPSEHAVLCPHDLSQATESAERLLQECDGYSNLFEIGDRLGWPLRQLRLQVHYQLASGTLRLAVPQELLAIAAQELQQSNFARAGSRLTAWCECAYPGPLEPGDAEFLATEWQAGRLSSTVHMMPAKHARALMRRIDHAIHNPLAAAEHWAELAKAHRQDPISALRALMCQVRTGIDPNVPSIADLLAVARRFSDREQRMRARAVLRVAATRLPDAVTVRLDVGMNMLAAGLTTQAGELLIACARTLIDEGKYENAIPPLRAVIEALPQEREARRLLSRARTKAMQRTIVRKNSLVTIAVVLALSIGAVVQYRSHREYDRKLSAVNLAANEPRKALKLLDELFPDVRSGAVGELRLSLEQRMKSEEGAVRTTWTDRYREAQIECTLGDPVLGLQRALNLPAAPAQSKTDEPWPLVSDLYNGLAARLQTLLQEIGEAIQETSEQLHDEQRLANLIDDLQAVLQQKGSELATEARDFGVRLGEIDKNLAARSEERAQARADRLRQANLARQDLLLAAARAHAEAGDHARAMTVYQRLIESDETHKLADLLAKEMQVVDRKSKALSEARELALQGQHAKAKVVLTKSFESFKDYLLPWRLKTFPPGARARLGDGSVRVTPVQFESTFGEEVEISLELDGYEPIRISVKEPSDQLVVLSRVPERWWPTSSRVEASPLATGDDHVLADRSGLVVRMSKDSHIVWQHKLASLGGVARSPLFLPKKPGHLLLVTEDGQAWIVDAGTGSMDGPLDLGSPPLEGPVASESGARLRLRDGRVAQWESRLNPEFLPATAVDPALPLVAGSTSESLANGSSAGLALLRRGSASGNRLESPWTGDSIEVSDACYTVRSRGSNDASFTVRKTGEWSFVAWEAPHSLIPRGRLWIADGRGLASFQP